MILFFISLIFVLISTYLITSLITKKNNAFGLLYFPILGFSQIVFTFEFLSLFSAIKAPYVLLFNILFTLAAIILWLKHDKPLWYFDKETIQRFFRKIKNSLKLDKTLAVLALCYLFFIVITVFLCTIMPVASGDGKAYHAARSFFYVINGNLNHYVTSDIRSLCLPFNSEILYAWVILFIKKDLFLGFFSFIGYFMAIVATFNIMGYINFSYRRRLWIIFILSSFSSVLVQPSGTETDIIIAGLITSSILMFWNSLKTDSKLPLFMSALAYALAIGTKTPSIIMIPAVGFLMLSLCIYYKKYQTLFKFIGFGIVNFLIFSSYNYILNLIEYKNIAGPEYFMVVSKNYDGIKGACANFIKYIFMFFDFTGFRWSDYMMNDLLKIKETVLAFFGLAGMKDGLYTTDIYFQRSLVEQLMGAGILGFITYLPCWIWSLLQVKTKYKIKKILFIYGFVFLINLITISCMLAYMSYSVRFIMAFMVISAPILYYSYFSNKNPLKYIMIYFSIYYLVCVSSHIWVRPFFKTIKILKQTHSIQRLRQVPICNSFDDITTVNTDCKVRNHIKKYKKDTKILYIPESGTNYVGLGKLILEGYDITMGEPEYVSFMNSSFDEYDIIITPAEYQRATKINDFENRKDECITNPEKKTVKCVIKKPYNCYYEYNSRISKFDKNGKMRSPLAVTCMMKPEYFETKGYYISRIVGVPDNRITTNTANFYIFYQNKNKTPNVK